MTGPVKRRAYDASGRKERARQTRRQVLDAARRLFVRHGYAETRMTDVATAADVSVELIYGAFGSKADLLKTVFDVTIAGDDEPVALMDRPALLEVRREPDPERALRLYAAFVAEAVPLVAPVHLVILQAALSEHSIAALSEELDAQRLRGMTLFAEHLGASARLAIPQDEARDLLWTLNSVRVFELLVEQRGWGLDRYEAFLADTWVHQLLT